MPAKSKQQQKFFGVVKAMQKGDIPKKGAAGKVASDMSKKDVSDFASTKHKGLPKKVNEAKNDFVARFGNTDIVLKRAYKHYTEDQLYKLYNKLGKLIKPFSVKDATLVFEKIKGADGKACWKGYRYAGTEDGKDKCVKVNETLGIAIWESSEPVIFQEAEYQGRKVELNKPTRGDTKKFKVYVNSGKKNADGTIKVKKVEFGHRGKGNEKTMRIKKNNPERRKSFRARHNCDNPGPKTSARYWSCKAW